MRKIIHRNTMPPFIMLIACACLLLAGGCVRYAHNVDTLYGPSGIARGGSGEVYIVIPENLQTHSSGIKWVLGKVKDDDNNTIDELFSPRSPAEIIQGAFVQEFKRAGYTVIATSKRPAAEQRVIDLTRTEITLEQTSDIADLKARCSVLVAVDVFREGQLIKRFQYESESSRSDIKDRDILAGNVLEDALQSIMLKAMPELHSLFRP